MESLAKRIGISKNLLEMVENGGVTHPKIARIIGEVYGLEEKDILELSPVKSQEDKPSTKWTDFKIVSNPVQEIDTYIHDNQKKGRR